MSHTTTMHLSVFFRSATARLSLFYVAVAMTLCIGFSWLFYQSADRELNHELRRPPAFSQAGLPNNFAFDKFRSNRLQESEQNLRTNLFILNFFALLTVAALSYYAAKRTIEPIEAALAAQARFASDASHELRTPLAAMKTEIEVALRDNTMKKAALEELLASNLEEIEKLQGLSDGLLKLATKPQAIDKAPLAVQDIVGSAVNRLAKAAAAKHLTIDRQVGDLWVHGNRDALNEVVFVLLDNAIKYSPEAGTITISSQPNHKEVWLTVADQGPGIAAEQLPHIFERFYRADSSRTKNNGTAGYGLGLSIAQQFVQAHGGAISVKSGVGEGSRFTVRLAAAHANEQKTAAA